VYKISEDKDPLVYSRKVINKLIPDIVECSTWRYELLDFSR
jgi:hypothetical protein